MNNLKIRILVQRRAAFTLIEMLVSMSIIITLALVAIGNYSGVSRQARLDFAADALASLLKQQGQFAQSGKLASAAADAKLQCFVIQIEKAAVFSGAVAYVGVPVVDVSGSLTLDQIDTCDMAAGSLVAGVQPTAILQQDLVVEVLFPENLANLKPPLELYFKPPYGRVFQKDVANNLKPFTSNLQLKVRYNSGSAAISRSLEFHPQTGEVKRI